MKKIILLFIALFFLNLTARTQSKVESIDLKGKTYTVCIECRDFPNEIMGEYLYEGKGEPKVVLDKNGTGSFQPHMVDPIKIKFWFDCDESGTIRTWQGEGRYQYTLLIQYLEGSSGAYPVGGYDLMGVMVRKTEGVAVIYGERYKKLN
jgi:hypothetical protein